jgi:AcrR family transcriptional regulator
LPAAKRAAVVSAAEAEFAAKGFSGGSLNVIARDAGVAKGSLFQYFADKADLFGYLSDLASLRIRAAMEVHIDQIAWEAGFFPALGQLFDAWVAYFRCHPVDLALTAAVNLEPDPAARVSVRDVVNRHYVEVLRPLLESAQAEGGLRAEADLDAFLALLLLIFPHLALAPNLAGLDPVLGLASDRAARPSGVARLLATLEAAFGVQ